MYKMFQVTIFNDEINIIYVKNFKMIRIVLDPTVLNSTDGICENNIQQLFKYKKELKPPIDLVENLCT